MTQVLEFIKKNFVNIFYLIGLLFLLYWVVYVITPKIKMSVIDGKRIDSIDSQLKKISESNEKLENNIQYFDTKINKLDSKITNIRVQKEIIREYYYEKINNVDNLTDAELDSFFTKRYKY